MHRVFHEPELQEALSLTGGDLAGAAALLWSVKEAVAKALGCAFHSVSPRQINVYPAVGRDGGYTFPVGLIRQGAGAVSLKPRRVHLGAVAALSAAVAFHRPRGSARSMRRWAALIIAYILRLEKII